MQKEKKLKERRRRNKNEYLLLVQYNKIIKWQKILKIVFQKLVYFSNIAVPHENHKMKLKVGSVDCSFSAMQLSH